MKHLKQILLLSLLIISAQLPIAYGQEEAGGSGGTAQGTSDGVALSSTKRVLTQNHVSAFLDASEDSKYKRFADLYNALNEAIPGFVASELFDTEKFIWKQSSQDIKECGTVKPKFDNRILFCQKEGSIEINGVYLAELLKKEGKDISAGIQGLSSPENMDLLEISLAHELLIYRQNRNKSITDDNLENVEITWLRKYLNNPKLLFHEQKEFVDFMASENFMKRITADQRYDNWYRALTICSDKDKHLSDIEEYILNKDKTFEYPYDDIYRQYLIRSYRGQYDIWLKYSAPPAWRKKKRAKEEAWFIDELGNESFDIQCKNINTEEYETFINNYNNKRLELTSANAAYPINDATRNNLSNTATREVSSARNLENSNNIAI